MRDTLRRFQLLLAVTQLTLGHLTLGDMPPHSAVTDKTPGLVKYRQARNGHVPLAAVRGGPRELKVSEWQAGIQGLAVLAPGLGVRLQVRHFPSGFPISAFGSGASASPSGKLLTNEAMFRI